jgi:hypothetical protein
MNKQMNEMNVDGKIMLKWVLQKQNVNYTEQVGLFKQGKVRSDILTGGNYKNYCLLRCDTM